MRTRSHIVVSGGWPASAAVAGGGADVRGAGVGVACATFWDVCAGGGAGVTEGFGSGVAGAVCVAAAVEVSVAEGVAGAAAGSA